MTFRPLPRQQLIQRHPSAMSSPPLSSLEAAAAEAKVLEPQAATIADGPSTPDEDANMADAPGTNAAEVDNTSTVPAATDTVATPVASAVAGKKRMRRDSELSSSGVESNFLPSGSTTNSDKVAPKVTPKASSKKAAAAKKAKATPTPSSSKAAKVPAKKKIKNAHVEGLPTRRAALTFEATPGSQDHAAK